MSVRSRQAYKNALKSLAARTGTPLPSLIVSFAVLHEITAVVPLAGLFFGAKYFGVGERLVDYIRTETHADAASSHALTTRLAQRVEIWIDEGEVWAEKVGRRYAVFGYPKTPKGAKFEPVEGKRGHGVAGDVANVVFAYTATKVSNPSDPFLLYRPGTFFLGSCSGQTWGVVLLEPRIFEKSYRTDQKGVHVCATSSYLEFLFL